MATSSDPHRSRRPDGDFTAGIDHPTVVPANFDREDAEENDR